jgi:hypothetical protein
MSLRDVPPPQAEAWLIAQLSRIEKSIADLENERAAIRKLLLRIRGEQIVQTDVSRKNSVRRILIESKITEILTSARKPVPSRTLFNGAQTIAHDLNSNTFRSYLLRLKKRGVIMPTKHRVGMWEITKSS